MSKAHDEMQGRVATKAHRDILADGVGYVSDTSMRFMLARDFVSFETAVCNWADRYGLVAELDGERWKCTPKAQKRSYDKPQLTDYGTIQDMFVSFETAVCNWADSYGLVAELDGERWKFTPKVQKRSYDKQLTDYGTIEDMTGQDDCEII